jgi:hypothetical protein
VRGRGKIGSIYAISASVNSFWERGILSYRSRITSV